MSRLIYQHLRLDYHHTPAQNNTSSTVSQTQSPVKITIATPTGQGSRLSSNLIMSLVVTFGLVFQRLISCRRVFFMAYVIVIAQCFFQNFYKFFWKPPSKYRFNVHARIVASSSLAVVTKCGLTQWANPKVLTHGRNNHKSPAAPGSFNQGKTKTPASLYRRGL